MASIQQRAHDETNHRSTGEVEAVATTGEVHVIAARLIGRSGEGVVTRIVDAAKRDARTTLVALAGVVVDDVENDFDAGVMQRPNQRLELRHRRASRLTGRV